MVELFGSATANRAEAVRYHDAFVARVRALAVMHDDDKIVALQL